MATEEKLVNQDGFKNDGPLNVAESDPYWQAGHERGLANESMLEPLPKRITTSGEDVINRGNAWIVLGRDRPGSRASGYGGGGATQASAIDICVGMGGPLAGPAEAEFVDPNFRGDAARIYISQRSDIDDAFRINTEESNSGIGSSQNQSAIGIKADSVRVIGVNGIKLITRPQNKDSRDGFAAYNGIELIACNDQKSLQYMVKGENLVKALSDMEERVTALSAMVMTFLAAQLKFNTVISSHGHIGPKAEVGPSFSLIGTGIETATKEVEGAMNNFIERLNLNITWHNKYLGSMSSEYILSKYNKVN